MSLSTMTVWVYMVRWGPRTVPMLPSPLLHHSPREEKTDVDRKQFLFEQVTCKFIFRWPEQGLVTKGDRECNVHPGDPLQRRNVIPWNKGEWTWEGG